jgi:hypothetical protein
MDDTFCLEAVPTGHDGLCWLQRDVVSPHHNPIAILLYLNSTTIDDGKCNTGPVRQVGIGGIYNRIGGLFGDVGLTHDDDWRTYAVAASKSNTVH